MHVTPDAVQREDGGSDGLMNLSQCPDLPHELTVKVTSEEFDTLSCSAGCDDCCKDVLHWACVVDLRSNPGLGAAATVLREVLRARSRYEL